MATRRHRVVVIGAGFGGLAAVRALAGVPVDVVMIDARNHHTFQPLLYQVATAGLDGDDVCYAVRGLVARQRNVDVRLGRVTSIDLHGRLIGLADGTQVEYDHLVVAAGAVTNDFGVPGVAEHSFGMKSLEDAMAIRTHVLLQFERADARPDLVQHGALTIVIAGGGPTGVELAGGMVELFHTVLHKDFPHLDTRRARVVLVEATDRLLPTFDPRLGENARATLERRGVEVMVDTTVAEVSPTSVRLADGRSIDTATMIWAAGVRAHPLAETMGVELTKGGRIVTLPDLSVPGHPEVFVVGDMAGTTGPDGGLLPQVAPVAMQGARHVAEQIHASLRGEPTTPFHYVDKGSMATIGRRDAVAQLPGGLRLTGTVGWLAWLGLHLVMLIGFRNRANVLVNWAWNYVTYDRGSRIISGSEAAGSRHVS
jgi:NADH dehydrogenase